MSLLESVNTGSWYSEKYLLNYMNYAFEQMLTNESPKANQPSSILLSLKDHQRALLYAMAKKENECMNGYNYHGTTTFSDYAILADDVGTGKSLVILAHIAAMKEAKSTVLSRNTMYGQSTSHFFTIQKTVSSNTNSNLLVVPHTIYKQWEQYCKTQTSLNVYYVKSVRDLDILGKEIPGLAEEDEEEIEEPKPKKKGSKKVKEKEKEKETLKEKPLTNEEKQKRFREADIVLCSNTLYRDVQVIAEALHVKWTRLFLDEADSIYISGSSPYPNATFTWFITATWTNFVHHGGILRGTHLLEYKKSPNDWSQRVYNWLVKELGVSEIPQSTITSPYQHYYGVRYVHYRIRSYNWLRDYLSHHILTSHLILHCTTEFLQESEQMPPIHHQTIECEQSISSRIVRGIVSKDIQAMLDAGSIETALENLGVSTTNMTNLVEAVTAEREKELKRLRSTLEFKKSFDYASPLAKEQAITSLTNKISSVEEQLRTIQNRLSNSSSTEECPICYENSKENNCVLTPCCNRMFCGKCVLTSLTRTPTCPMCRHELSPSQLTHISNTNVNLLVKKEVKRLRSKQSELIHFMKENPNARVLVFCRYENPFHNLGKTLEFENIEHTILKGNKDVIASQIRSFETGEKRVLFLPTETAAAGMNLVSATHIVLLHAMTPDEEKQIVGRAYRLGRKDPLHVIHLLHEGEKIQ